MKKRDVTRVNEFEIVGRCIAVRRNYRKNKVLITVFCANSKDKRYDAYPQIVCREVPDNILHKQVRVTGHLQIFPVKTDEQIVNRQKFVADNISLCETMLENKFGVHGKYFAQASATVSLSGSVEKIIDDGAWLRVSMNVGADKPLYVRASIKKDNKMAKFACGDTVCCICGVNTPRREFNGKLHHYEDLNVTDISVI